MSRKPLHQEVNAVHQALGASLAAGMAEAEAKAWESLAKYKFWLFGYHAAQWVLLNRVSAERRPNPWKDLVRFASGHQSTVNKRKGEDNGAS